MKSVICFFLLALLFVASGCVQTETVSTSGDNSPAIIAKNFSVTYGVRPDAVEAILSIYEAGGYDVDKRRKATEQILKEYAQSPEKQQNANELSEASRYRMGINNSPEISNALEWDLFARNHYLSTMGYNSPAVVAKGDVNIWYGIPPKVLRALVAQLDKNKTTFTKFETQLEAQIKKYEELKTELKTYGSKEKIYRQAEALLEEGKLEEAERLIESDFDASMKRQAYKGYIYGKTKELLLKYEEAAKGFKNAINNDEGNSTYHVHYAFNESTLGHYDEAIRHYEIALGLVTLGSENEELIATLFNNLGATWDSKGDYEKAIDYFEKALQIYLTALGDNHSKVATEYNNLGLSWRSKDDYEKAIAYSEKALRIFLMAFGNNHPNVATGYNNLGLAWNSKGDYDKAIDYYDKALQIYLMAFGNNHPNVGIGYINLGSVWRSKGDYDKAIEYIKKGLQIFFMTLGDNHPDVATGYINLGLALQEKREYDKAIEYTEKALQINIKTFGESHPNIATGYNNLGLSWDSKGDYDKAIDYYEKALRINIKAFGENHSKIATQYNNIGCALQAKGEYDQAISYYEKSQFILDDIFKPTHFDQKNTAENLSHAAKRRGMELYNEKKYQEALGYFQKALKNARRAGDAALSLACQKSIDSTQGHLRK